MVDQMAIKTILFIAFCIVMFCIMFIWACILIGRKADDGTKKILDKEERYYKSEMKKRG